MSAHVTDRRSKSQRVAGIKDSAFKDDAHETALFDKELMDRHIVYFTLDMGTDGFHEVEIFR